MQRVAVRELGEGLHPSEVIVSIATSQGDQQVAVDRRSVVDHKLKAYVVGQIDDQVLVELPRETVSGAWRVWVSSSSMSYEEASG